MFEIVFLGSHHLNCTAFALLRLHFVPVDQAPDLRDNVHSFFELFHSVHLSIFESFLDSFVEVFWAERIHDLEVIFAGATYVEEVLSVRCPFLAIGVLIWQIRED